MQTRQQFMANFEMRAIIPGTLALIWFCTPVAAAAQQHQTGDGPLAPLADVLQAAASGFQVPGVGLVVVHGGETTFAHAVGTTEIGGAQAVDVHTIFPIGSNAKAFTATLLAMLVHDGKLGWDDPVRQHLPDVRFADDYLTEHVTVRDLLGMRTGVASDLMWLGSGLDRQELLQRLQHVAPIAPFRAQWIYSNLNYVLAGEIVERLTGMRWEDAVSDRIFQPLQMTRSSAVAVTDGNSVASHALVDGVVHAVEHPDLTAVAPAGDINSTLSDMARWLHFQLSGRAADGQQLLPPGILAEIHSPQMLMPEFSAYGMGWRLFPTYRGQALPWATHDGSTLGAISSIAVVPSRGIGIVVLGNRGDAAMSQAVMLDALDAVLGLEPRQRVASAVAARPGPRSDAPLIAGTAPPLPLDAYTGRYEDPALGALEVVREDGGLVLRRGRWTGELHYHEGNSFVAVWRDPYFTAAFGRTTIAFDSQWEPSAVLFLGARFRRAPSE
jgi:CubicO group peptidase (beta-lactamase class C family)